MDPLEALLRPVATILNRNIGEITRARELCARLDGKVVAVRVRDSALSMFVEIDNEILVLSSDTDSEPDALITGSLLTLARLAGGGAERAVREGSIDLTGDARVAEAFQELLACAKPDVEEELSTVIGDVAAHRIGNIARSVGGWARNVRATMGDNIREYLQEESRDAPSRYEVDRFTKDLHALRDDVDRAEARLNRLEGRE